MFSHISDSYVDIFDIVNLQMMPFIDRSWLRVVGQPVVGKPAGPPQQQMPGASPVQALAK